MASRPVTLPSPRVPLPITAAEAVSPNSPSGSACIHAHSPSDPNSIPEIQLFAIISNTPASVRATARKAALVLRRRKDKEEWLVGCGIAKGVIHGVINHAQLRVA